MAGRTRGAHDRRGVTFSVYAMDTNAIKNVRTKGFRKKIANTQIVGYVKKAL
jgi:hypothetical protein